MMKGEDYKDLNENIIIKIVVMNYNLCIKLLLLKLL